MEPLVTENDFRKTYKLEKFADTAIEKMKLKFPVYPNTNLAKIVSFLTFDGHLRWDGNVFLFTAGKRSLLKESQLLVRKEFGVEGVFRKMDTNSYGVSYEYRVTNKPICRILEALGVPKGSKVLIPFSVPDWIKKDPDLSRAYLQTAFDCEGTVWKERKNSLKIRFRMNKSVELIEDGISFLTELKDMLSVFGIGTSAIWKTAGNRRKDGNLTVGLCFNILANSIPLFRQNIGFTLKHKRILLNGVAQQHGTERREVVV